MIPSTHRLHVEEAALRHAHEHAEHRNHHDDLQDELPTLKINHKVFFSFKEIIITITTIIIITIIIIVIIKENQNDLRKTARRLLLSLILEASSHRALPKRYTKPNLLNE